MFDFIYDCFCIPKKKKKVIWIIGDEEFNIKKKDDPL